MAIVIRKTTGEVDECNLSAQLEKKNAIFVIFTKFPLHKRPHHSATTEKKPTRNSFLKIEAFQAFVTTLICRNFPIYEMSLLTLIEFIIFLV